MSSDDGRYMSHSSRWEEAGTGTHDVPPRVALEQDADCERQVVPPSLKGVAELVVEVPGDEAGDKRGHPSRKQARDRLLGPCFRRGQVSDQVGRARGSQDENQTEQDLVVERIGVGDAKREQANARMGGQSARVWGRMGGGARQRTVERCRLTSGW